MEKLADATPWNSTYGPIAHVLFCGNYKRILKKSVGYGLFEQEA